MRVQYITPPPDIPEFLYKSNATAWRNLIVWAHQEHKSWRMYLARNGYYKELKYFENNISPVVILAQSPRFRKLCAFLAQDPNQRVWDSFSLRERSFIRRAYGLRDLLHR